MPEAVDERGARILDAVLLHLVRRRDRRRVVDDEVHAVAASRDAEMRELREEVDVAVAVGPQVAGVVAVADRAWIAQVQAGEIGREVCDDHARRRLMRVEEAHANELPLAVAGRQWMELGMGLVEVERERVRPRGYVGPRPLGDAQQEDDLIVHHGGRGVEHGDDLELR